MIISLSLVQIESHLQNTNIDVLYREVIDLKLDLLEEYANPAPFPNDEFDELEIPSNQAYIMFSTSKTGDVQSRKRAIIIFLFKYIFSRMIKGSRLI